MSPWFTKRLPQKRIPASRNFLSTTQKVDDCPECSHTHTVHDRAGPRDSIGLRAWRSGFSADKTWIYASGLLALRSGATGFDFHGAGRTQRRPRILCFSTYPCELLYMDNCIFTSLVPHYFSFSRCHAATIVTIGKKGKRGTDLDGFMTGLWRWAFTRPQRKMLSIPPMCFSSHCITHICPSTLLDGRVSAESW
ncbi:hypothetical protein BKA81DRAFT_81035 [Phyllosticta paracitricarpa]